MPFSNNLKKHIDLPVWEWLRFFPAANSALSEMASIETADNRYIYMLVSSTFFRYDTYNDVWTSLAPPVTAPLLVLSLKYFPYSGYHGAVASATATTITGPFLQGRTFIGSVIRIISGTGNGQEKTITGHEDAVIADSGIVLAGGASTLTITDPSKKWDINQWTGYQVKIVNFIGQSQYRKILYNSATVLTVSDPLWQPYCPKESQAFVGTAPQNSTYHIESNVITTASWTVTPDSSSRFRILSGAISCLSTTASAPFQTLQFYDIASDVWFTLSCQQGLLLAAGAVANDISHVRLGEAETGTFVSGTATVTGSSVTTLGDTTKTWTVDQWTNYEIKITAGTNVGATRRILGNTATVLYTSESFTTSPDATSTYAIRPLRSVVFTSGCALASMISYDVDYDMWLQSFGANGGGVTNAMSIRYVDTLPIGVTATRALTGIKTILSTPTAGGTGYVVGDVLTCNQTGSGGLLIVATTDNAGIVTGLKLQKSGTGYAVASGRTTTGGTGSGCTFEITVLATIGTITTLINHNFQKGQSIIYGGASDSAWNTTYTVLGTSGLTSLDVEIVASASAVAGTAQSTSVIVDGSKSWVVNEHIGKIVQLSLTGLTGTSLMRKITSNTATSITIFGSVLGVAAVNGTGRYVIYDLDAFGKAVQYKNPVLRNTGWATGGTSTTLVDNTKAWKGNQWLGYKVKVICGTGYANGELTITSNTPTTLAVSGGYGFTPNTTTKYIIQDTFGVLTTVTSGSTSYLYDTTKTWQDNQWLGYKVRITAGEGVGQEFLINSNYAGVIYISGVLPTLPVALSSTYTILGAPVRGTGHELMWASNTTTNAGRYIISPRGGATNLFDRFDINTNTWDLTFACKPDTETFTVGTMYAYDGNNRIYIQKDSTGRIFYVDLETYAIHGAGTMPYVIGTSGIGTAVNGNRMEVIQTIDGLKYLYVMKHTGAALSATGGGTEMFRELIVY